MNKQLLFILLMCCTSLVSISQGGIPMDTTHWDIQAKAFIIEEFRGQQSLYIQNGFAALKDSTFVDGTIEFDVFLTERQAFPGVRFRANDNGDMEAFFLRPHLSKKPDGNQAASIIGGLTAFQLYFGPAYSFEYDYNFDDWTHVEIRVKGKRAQVFMDYSNTPQLSWNLKHEPFDGKLGVGGSFAPMHYANFKMKKETPELIDFKVDSVDVIPDLIPTWTVSDKFPEEKLDDWNNLSELISERKWLGNVEVEEMNAANISWVVRRYSDVPGNTVFARLNVNSDSDQMKLFHFGYSDRAVVLLNGQPIYRGNNKWRSRDYRYLGTIGLFDAVYLNLKKGKNELLIAVSEDFGGWGITGKFESEEGIKIQYN